MLLLAGLGALACGCAETRYVMAIDASDADAGRVWPAPATREVPRYRYLGQLTGEHNFKPAEDSRAGVGTVLRWLVGLGETAASPNVLRRPQSGAVDERGRIFVTDASRKAVFVFDEQGGRFDVWDEAASALRFVSPVGIAVGAGGQLLVTDSELGRVFRLDRDGKPAGEFGAGILRRPTGIVRDPARRIVFVADTYAHDIKMFDDDGRFIDTLGQRGAQGGEFNYPTHLGFSRGTLYVTDVLNSRVQAISAAGTVQLSFGERGLYVGNLVRPKGVAVDDEGNIYIVESMYDNLLVFDSTGRFLMSIGGTGSDVGKFFLPAGVWTDGRNRVFVADMFNGRVVVFQFLGGE